MTQFPAPASYLPSSVRKGSAGLDQPPDPFAIPESVARDPRVMWAQKTETTLKQERAGVTKEMQRNRDMYEGRQWTGQRAPWKNQSVINYAAWVVDHWTAVLSDNKPRPTFEAHKPADQWQADIISFSYAQDSVDYGYETAKEDAIQCSRISKVAYVYQTFDPLVRYGGNDGAIVLRSIDGPDVYVDKDARDLNNASVVMIERREPVGAILFRYPHLQGRANVSQNELANMGSGSMSPVPAGRNYSNQNPGGKHTPPYWAPTARMTNDGGTGGQKLLEFYTFPKGPDAQTEVSRIKFTADNRIALKRKLIEFEDGTTEPMQTIVTEGNIVYEVPMSVASMLSFAAEALHGLEIKSVQDTYEVERQREKVPLYPTGRRTVVVGDFVADDGCNPFAHGRVPLAAYHAYRKGNGYFGFSDIDRIYSQCEYLNRLNALILDAAILTGNPVWLIPTETQIADEDITNAPGAVIRGDGMMLKLARREPGPNLPPYIASHLGFTIQQIKEISGLSEAATGGKFKGQQAAETVSMYQEAAGIRFRQGQRNVEAAEVEIGIQYESNVKQFYTEPRLLRIKDKVGAEKPIAFVGMHLDAPMRLTVKPGSSLPSSPSARLNLVMQLATSPLPVYDMPALWKILQEVGLIDSASEIEQRVRKYMAGPQSEMVFFPALMALLHPPQPKGGKNKGGANKGNGGRSVRRSTPAGGAMSAA